MNKALLLLCFLCLGFGASAQNTFKYSAKVGPIDTPGFYAITLQPGLVAKSKADLSDLRLLDDSGRFVPYVLATGQPTFWERDNSLPYISFPIVNSRAASDTGTIFIVKNVSTTPVDNLEIKLRNAAVERTLNLYGGDDLKQWFAIKENIPIQPAAVANSADYKQWLSFPPSNYHYLKLVVNDKHRAPIKFLAAGTNQHKLLPTRYAEITGTKFVKRDSGKITFVAINLGGDYWVDKISLTAQAPKFYNRNVSVYNAGERTHELLATGALRSGDDGAMLIGVKTDKLLLEIENQDNPPLNINRVRLFQTDRSMLAYLEAGRAYKLLTGDVKAISPNYDLKFFTDSTKNRVLKITHNPVEKNPLYIAPVLTVKAGNQKTIIIWLAVVAALLLLSLLTWKMAGEVKKRG